MALKYDVISSGRTRAFQAMSAITLLLSISSSHSDYIFNSKVILKQRVRDNTELNHTSQKCQCFRNI